MNKQDQDQQIETLFRQEYLALYRYVYTMVGHPDDALEIVQETFLRFYRLMRNKEVRANERALLFRLARNLAIELMRKSRTRETYQRNLQAGNLVVLNLSPAKTPEEVLLERERQRCVEEALGHLGKREQECLELRRCGLSYQEVAATLNLNPQSIGQIIARALRKFREIYGEILEKKVPAGKARSAR